MADIGSVVAGLFGGFGGTFLWEVFIKPWRDRRGLAYALAAELDAIAEHADIVLTWLDMLTGPQLPPHFGMATVVFDAVAARIAELPSSEIAAVLRVYRAVSVSRDRAQTLYEQALAHSRHRDVAGGPPLEQPSIYGWRQVSSTRMEEKKMLVESNREQSTQLAVVTGDVVDG